MRGCTRSGVLKHCDSGTEITFLALTSSLIPSLTSDSRSFSGLISFRMDWFDFLVVQGTLKSLFQHHTSKASILQHSAFFMVQLSHHIHDYWKNDRFG